MKAFRAKLWPMRWTVSEKSLEQMKQLALTAVTPIKSIRLCYKPSDCGSVLDRHLHLRIGDETFVLLEGPSFEAISTFMENQ